MIRSLCRKAWTAAVLLAAATPLATQSAVLTTHNATGPGLYGSAVAIDGDVALVGAPGDAIHGNNYTGSVLVYRRVQGSWQEEQKLTGSGGALLDYFGRSVAIQGNVAVVGAPATLSKTNLTGTVYIFRHNGSAWVEEAKFGRGAGCGTSVDIDGDRVIVGASATRLGGQNFTGAAWVFRYSSTSKTWSEEGQLVANDGVGSDWFGGSVAIEGTRALVGAHGEGDGSTLYGIGSVYAYEYGASGWTQTQKFRASNFGEQSFFGRPLALDGGRAVVGSPGKKAGGWWGAGSAYVFERGATGYTEIQKLDTPWPTTNTKFGTSVAISQDLICVLSYGRDGEGRPAGAVHPFRWNGTTYVEEPPFKQFAPMNNEEGFGDALALDGDTLLASAYIQNKSPVAEGSVFVFDVQPRFHTWVHPMPLLSNDTAKFEMRHGTKGAPQLLFFGFSGSTHIPLPWPGTSIDILSPVLIAAAIADGNGGSKWEINVPTSALGVKLWVQGFEFPTTTSLDSSNYWYSEVQNGG